MLGHVNAILTFLHKGDALLLLHFRFVELLDKAVDKATSRSTDGVLLTDHHSAQRHRVHLTAQLVIVSGNDDSRNHRITETNQQKLLLRFILVPGFKNNPLTDIHSKTSGTHWPPPAPTEACQSAPRCSSASTRLHLR